MLSFLFPPLPKLHPSSLLLLFHPLAFNQYHLPHLFFLFVIPLLHPVRRFVYFFILINIVSFLLFHFHVFLFIHPLFCPFLPFYLNQHRFISLLLLHVPPFLFVFDLYILINFSLLPLVFLPPQPSPSSFSPIPSSSFNQHRLPRLSFSSSTTTSEPSPPY